MLSSESFLLDGVAQNYLEMRSIQYQFGLFYGKYCSSLGLHGPCCGFKKPHFFYKLYAFLVNSQSESIRLLVSMLPSHRPSICLSVCLSRSCSVLKRQKILIQFLLHIRQPHVFSTSIGQPLPPQILPQSGPPMLV